MDRKVGSILNAHQFQGWIPIRLYWNENQPLIDWCWVGTRRYTEPFFDHTIDACLRLPFATLCRPQTPVKMLGDRHAINPGLQPTGFIFHMSRCGSTLLAQMFASLPKNVVISEAGTIDSVLRGNLRVRSLSDADRIDWLKWTVSALAQRRSGDEEQLFIKFDSWAMVELPLIHRAFPDVPWIFLYRNPIEVLASQVTFRGAHMVPGGIEPELFGLTLGEVVTMQPEEYCARILAVICEAGLQHQRSYGGMLVNYEQLPEAAWTEIAKFFRVDVSEFELEAFQRVALRSAKNPQLEFESDSRAKRENATNALRDASARWLDPVFERLEAARLGDAKS